jgi:hypothetical protein
MLPEAVFFLQKFVVLQNLSQFQRRFSFHFSDFSEFFQKCVKLFGRKTTLKNP